MAKLSKTKSHIHDENDRALYRLAKRRIESCIEILKQNGIKQEHFVIYAGGECCPVEKETFEDGTYNPEARSKNRRATLKLIE